MGRSIPVRYVLKMTCTSRRHYTGSAWHVKSGPNRTGYGKPTVENIDKYVRGFEQSMIDGPNKHLGIDQVLTAEIYDHNLGRVVARWVRSEQMKDQPMFQVIS